MKPRKISRTITYYAPTWDNLQRFYSVGDLRQWLDDLKRMGIGDDAVINVARPLTVEVHDYVETSDA